MLHLPLESHGTVDLVSHALHPIGAPCPSPFVAGGGAPGHALYTLQPLDEKSLRARHACWHRFCPLLEWRPHGGRGMTRQHPGGHLYSEWPKVADTVLETLQGFEPWREGRER